MVLDDASASPTSTGDTLTTTDTSDFDPYSSPTSSTSGTYNTSSSALPPGYTLDLDRFPRPVPIIGRLFGFSNQRRTDSTLASYASLAAIVRRPLTVEEADAVAYHIAKGAAIASWGEPFGLAAGYWRYATTRKEFRFPFFKPDLETLNRQKFLGLRGQKAEFAWRAIRCGAYLGLSGYVGRFILGTYAATVVAIGQRNDGRMRDVVQAISQIGGEEAGRRARSTPEWERRRGGGRGGQRVEQGGKGYEGDREERGMGYGDVQPEGDVEGRDYMSGGGGRDLGQMARDQPQESSGGLAFDDASPTAGQEQQQGGQGGNVWDQLRRGGRPQGQQQQHRQSLPQDSGQSAPPSRAQNQSSGNAWASMRNQQGQGGQRDIQREQREGSTTGDAYSFSNSEAERAEAKAQAQRDFDERLERERQGKDFGDDGSSRRWR